MSERLGQHTPSRESIPTRISTFIVRRYLGDLEASDRVRELERNYAQHRYVATVEYFQEVAKTFDHEDLADIKLPIYQIRKRRKTREYRAALQLATEFWRERHGFRPLDTLDDEGFRYQEVMEIHKENVISRVEAVPYKDTLTTTEQVTLQKKVNNVLSHGSETQKDIFYQLGDYTEKERKNILERGLTSAALMAKFELSKEIIAGVVSVIGAYYAQKYFGDASFLLTYVGGNIPSWLALAPMALATAAMAEKVGVSPNALSTISNSLFKHAGTKTRFLMSAMPVVLWDFGKDIMFNLFPSVSQLIIKNVPALSGTFTGTMPEWLFFINGTVITLGHIYQTYWCHRQIRKSEQNKNIDN